MRLKVPPFTEKQKKNDDFLVIIELITLLFFRMTSHWSSSHFSKKAIKYFFCFRCSVDWFRKVAEFFFSFKMFLISRLSAAYNETSVFPLRFFFRMKKIKNIFFGVFQIKIVIRCESIFTKYKKIEDSQICSIIAVTWDRAVVYDHPRYGLLITCNGNKKIICLHVV